MVPGPVRSKRCVNILRIFSEMVYRLNFKQESENEFSIHLNGSIIPNKHISRRKKQIVKKFQHKLKVLRKKIPLFRDKELGIFVEEKLLEYTIRTCAAFLMQSHQNLVKVVLKNCWDIKPSSRIILGRILSLLTRLRLVELFCNSNDVIPLFQRLCNQSSMCNEKLELIFALPVCLRKAVSVLILQKGIENNCISLSKKQAKTKMYWILMKVRWCS